MPNRPLHISASGSTVVVGTARDIYNAPVIGLSAEQTALLLDFLAQLKAAAPTIPLPEASRKELTRQVEIIEAGMKAPPDNERKWLRQALSCIYGIVIGVAGNTTYDGIVETAKHFLSHG